MIENAMRQMEDEDERIKEAGEANEADEEAALFDYDKPIVEDADFFDFQDFEAR